MVAVDVAVVGGGLQGLVLLRELVSAGYASLLVTNGDLGSGQTLHSHGLLNSGTGLVTGALQDELHRFTLPYLRAIGVAIDGEDRSFLLAPDPMADQLAPAWAANGYRPERTDPSSLPPGLEPVAPAYRVQAYTVDKRRLVAALSAGLEHLVLQGDIVEGGEALGVRARASGETVPIQARAVVIAAGCGTKRLLRDFFAVDETVLARVAYTKMHMICVRGPAGVLPDVGTVVSPEVLVVAHPSLDGPRSHSRLVTWYVTPADPAPARHPEAPDEGSADVEASVVRSGIERLIRLVPGLSSEDERIEATVFAGYKQEFDGQPSRRACELLDGERSLVMALPSVLANAVPNAVEAVTMIRRRLEPTAPAPTPEVPGGEGVTVGQLNEHNGQMRWAKWSDFARMYGVGSG